MKVISLIENTSARSDLYTEHGLSLYLETKRHRVLFDTGASERFAENAQRLGVDLTEIDVLILSHGHYDHTGGIKRFFELNSHAKAYIQADAFAPYYHCSEERKEFIGVKSVTETHPRLTLLTDDLFLDNELKLFTNVTERKCFPETNLQLKYFDGENEIQDDFRHEQYLVVSDEGKDALISGCSHNGIVNILERYQELFHRQPDVVIGGFHTAGKGDFRPEYTEKVLELGRVLLPFDTVFYTCHCTGMEPYQLLKKEMGEHIQYLSTGEKIFL